MALSYISAIILVSLYSFVLCSQEHVQASSSFTEHQATSGFPTFLPSHCVGFGQACSATARCCVGECIPNGIRGGVCSPLGCKADNAPCTTTNSCCNKNGIVCRRKNTFSGRLEARKCLQCQGEGRPCRMNSDCCDSKAVCRRVAAFRSKRCRSNCVEKGRRCRRSRDCCNGRKCRRKFLGAKRCR